MTAVFETQNQPAEPPELNIFATPTDAINEADRLKLDGKSCQVVPIVKDGKEVYRIESIPSTNSRTCVSW